MKNFIDYKPRLIKEDAPPPSAPPGGPPPSLGGGGPLPGLGGPPMGGGMPPMPPPMGGGGPPPGLGGPPMGGPDSGGAAAPTKPTAVQASNVWSALEKALKQEK